MKKLIALVCGIVCVVALSYMPADAGVYRTKTRAACSGVSVTREYARGRSATCSGVGRAVIRQSIRAKRSCAGSL